MDADLKTILLIDDDQELGELSSKLLGRHGYQVTHAATGEAGMASLGSASPDLVILDVMLPGRDGFEVCRDIRSQSNVPIIMLTARGDVNDRIHGLKLGADDYLPKPFEADELVARIETVLRRGRRLETAEVLRFKGLSLDMAQRSVQLDGKDLDLTTAEFQLLAFLASRAGEPVNRDQISQHLQGTQWEALSRSVDVVMSRLRQKLNDDPRKPRFVRTVWGTGYMFVGIREEDG